RDQTISNERSKFHFWTLSILRVAHSRRYTAAHALTGGWVPVGRARGDWPAARAKGPEFTHRHCRFIIPASHIAAMIRRFLLALLFVVAAPALAQSAPVQPQHEWPFEQSDLPPDPAYRFGRLDNGMRYIIRPNGTPAGQGMVQFWVDAGSIAETDEERGYAHFVEHMA